MLFDNGFQWCSVLSILVQTAPVLGGWYISAAAPELKFSQVKVKVKIMLLPTVSRPVYLGVKHPSGAQDQDFCYRQTVAGLLMWGALCDERTTLSFTVAVGLRQCSHSRVRVLRDSGSYFIVSDLSLPQPGEPCPCITQCKIDSLCNLGTDRMANTSSENSSSFGCIPVAVGTCWCYCAVP
jgi:hypothetical protein